MPRVLIWNDIGTVHNAIGDHTPDEPRCTLRVQVMATSDHQSLGA
jgi:hypothetical protein